MCPTTPDDVGEQKVLVGEALAAVPAAVVFNPTDDRQMGRDLARFAAAGIPVVIFINRMEGKALTFVGSDDVAIGHAVAKALIDGLAGGAASSPSRARRRRRPAATAPTACARPWPSTRR